VGNRGLGGSVVRSPVKEVFQKIDMGFFEKIPSNLISGILTTSINCNDTELEMEVFEYE
jgi:hypothetical protein